MRSLARVLLALTLDVVYLSAAPANVILPSGLAAGTQYQLIFLTDGERDATSSNIADYNTFVSNEAALGVPFGLPADVIWHAVGSTATVHANVNAPSSGLAVYDTRGNQVAAASTGLYTASHLTGILFDQKGQTPVQSLPWTGMSDSTGGVSTSPLGSQFTAEVGNNTASNGTWSSANSASVIGNTHMYALSTPITATPEPGTAALLGSAFSALFLRRRRRHCLSK
jgi:hypothetical protein